MFIGVITDSLDICFPTETKLITTNDFFIKSFNDHWKSQREMFNLISKVEGSNPSWMPKAVLILIRNNYENKIRVIRKRARDEFINNNGREPNGNLEGYPCCFFS